jgi:hypothetical protein
MTDNAHLLWPSSGYRLLTPDARGHLQVTDAFLQSLLERPELAPIGSSCRAELDLHAALCEAPRQSVSAEQLAALQDRDAAENYAVWLRFRDRLLAKPTLEASYLALFEGEGVDVPPVLVQHITQILVQHVLGTEVTPLLARAAEMLFRTQKISVLEDGSVMAADHDTVERHAQTGGFGSLGELLKQGGIPTRSVDLDVLNDDDAQDEYWSRSERFDMVVCLNRAQPTPIALCKVLSLWIEHFLNVRVRIETAREIAEDNWVWHVGLDAQASRVLNDLFTGDDVDEDRMRRLLCLFVLEFESASDMRSDVAGRPVYLAMAMDAGQRLTLKPQNLLLNLPLALRS